MKWHLIGPVVPFMTFMIAAQASTIVAQPEVLPSLQRLTPAQAIEHPGETATVCGLVANATHPAHVQGEPTFLYLDKPRPEQIFTVVIWGSDREKFGQPELIYPGKNICITGQIELYGGLPRIVAKDPRRITIEAPRDIR